MHDSTQNTFQGQQKPKWNWDMNINGRFKFEEMIVKEAALLFHYGT